MAKRTVNKSKLVREYLANYPDKGPSEIARLITEEHGVPVTTKFVSTIKVKVRQSGGSAAPAAAAEPKKAAGPAKGKAPAAKAAKPNGGGAAALSQHIANLKSAAQKLGKDEAKRIIDLF